MVACPHGLTRLGSVIRATPGMSEIRFVWVYRLVVSPRLLAIGTATAPAATRAVKASQSARLRERDPRIFAPLLSGAGRVPAFTTKGPRRPEILAAVIDLFTARHAEN